jgi:hypothetical protein
MINRASAAGIALVGFACACSAHSSTSGSTPAPSKTSRVVGSPAPRLDPGQVLSLGDGESFVAARSTPNGTLTSDGAWAAYAQSHHARINKTQPPSTTVSYLGAFTDGGGRTHTPVYGYFTPNSTPASTGLNRPSPLPVCVQWVMLSGRTGAQIESSWICPITR